jgi:prolyl-tRNA synthetase
VVIVPIPKPNETLDAAAGEIKEKLKAKGISVEYDMDMRKRPGFKFAEHELRGVPVRLGIGMRDLENQSVEVARRDTREKYQVPLNEVTEHVEGLLDDIQNTLLERAKEFRENNTTVVDDFDAFKDVIENKGGFVYAHWDGTTETELRIKELTKATIRCVFPGQKDEPGKCILTGKPSRQRVVFARAY